MPTPHGTGTAPGERIARGTTAVPQRSCIVGGGPCVSSGYGFKRGEWLGGSFALTRDLPHHAMSRRRGRGSAKDSSSEGEAERLAPTGTVGRDGRPWWARRGRTDCRRLMQPGPWAFPNVGGTDRGVGSARGLSILSRRWTPGSNGDFGMGRGDATQTAGLVSLRVLGGAVELPGDVNA